MVAPYIHISLPLTPTLLLGCGGNIVLCSYFRLGHSFLSLDSLIFKRLVQQNLLLRNFQSFGAAKTVVSAALFIIDILLIFGCVYLSRFKSASFHVSWVLGTLCLLIFDLLILDFYENSWFNVFGPFLIDRAVQEAAVKWTEVVGSPPQAHTVNLHNNGLFNIWDYFSVTKLVLDGLGSQVFQIVPESNKIASALQDTLPPSFMLQSLDRTASPAAANILR